MNKIVLFTVAVIATSFFSACDTVDEDEQTVTSTTITEETLVHPVAPTSTTTETRTIRSY